jgi:hypothetical protein
MVLYWCSDFNFSYLYRWELISSKGTDLIICLSSASFLFFSSKVGIYTLSWNCFSIFKKSGFPLSFINYKLWVIECFLCYWLFLSSNIFLLILSFNYFLSFYYCLRTVSIVLFCKPCFYLFIYCFFFLIYWRNCLSSSRILFKY